MLLKFRMRQDVLLGNTICRVLKGCVCIIKMILQSKTTFNLKLLIVEVKIS